MRKLTNVQNLMKKYIMIYLPYLRWWKYSWPKSNFDKSHKAQRLLSGCAKCKCFIAITNHVPVNHSLIETFCGNSQHVISRSQTLINCYHLVILLFQLEFSSDQIYFQILSNILNYKVLHGLAKQYFDMEIFISSKQYGMAWDC